MTRFRYDLDVADAWREITSSVVCEDDVEPLCLCSLQCDPRMTTLHPLRRLCMALHHDQDAFVEGSTARELPGQAIGLDADSEHLRMRPGQQGRIWKGLRLNVERFCGGAACPDTISDSCDAGQHVTREVPSPYDALDVMDHADSVMRPVCLYVGAS